MRRYQNHRNGVTAGVVRQRTGINKRPVKKPILKTPRPPLYLPDKPNSLRALRLGIQQPVTGIANKSRNGYPAPRNPGYKKPAPPEELEPAPPEAKEPTGGNEDTKQPPANPADEKYAFQEGSNSRERLLIERAKEAPGEVTKGAGVGGLIGGAFGFLEALPTVIGATVAGAEGGALGGAEAGSVLAPGAGTVAGGAIGGVLGAIGGFASGVAAASGEIGASAKAGALIGGGVEVAAQGIGAAGEQIAYDDTKGRTQENFRRAKEVGESASEIARTVADIYYVGKGAQSIYKAVKSAGGVGAAGSRVGQTVARGYRNLTAREVLSAADFEISALEGERITGVGTAARQDTLFEAPSSDGSGSNGTSRRGSIRSGSGDIETLQKTGVTKDADQTIAPAPEKQPLSREARQGPNPMQQSTKITPKVVNDLGKVQAMEHPQTFGIPKSNPAKTSFLSEKAAGKRNISVPNPFIRDEPGSIVFRNTPDVGTIPGSIIPDDIQGSRPIVNQNVASSAVKSLVPGSASEQILPEGVKSGALSTPLDLSGEGTHRKVPIRREVIGPSFRPYARAGRRFKSNGGQSSSFKGKMQKINELGGGMTSGNALKGEPGRAYTEGPNDPNNSLSGEGGSADNVPEPAPDLPEEQSLRRVPVDNRLGENSGSAAPDENSQLPDTDNVFRSAGRYVVSGLSKILPGDEVREVIGSTYGGKIGAAYARQFNGGSVKDLKSALRKSESEIAKLEEKLSKENAKTEAGKEHLKAIEAEFKEREAELLLKKDVAHGKEKQLLAKEIKDLKQQHKLELKEQAQKHKKEFAETKKFAEETGNRIKYLKQDIREISKALPKHPKTTKEAGIQYEAPEGEDVVMEEALFRERERSLIADTPMPDVFRERKMNTVEGDKPLSLAERKLKPQQVTIGVQGSKNKGTQSDKLPIKSRNTQTDVMPIESRSTQSDITHSELRSQDEYNKRELEHAEQVKNFEEENRRSNADMIQRHEIELQKLESLLKQKERESLEVETLRKELSKKSDAEARADATISTLLKKEAELKEARQLLLEREKDIEGISEQLHRKTAENTALTDIRQQKEQLEGRVNLLKKSLKERLTSRRLSNDFFTNGVVPVRPRKRVRKSDITGE